jgi:hypothetical protein
MASNEMQRAMVFGITYRDEDFRNVIVLVGDKAIYKVSDGLGWFEEVMVDIEQAWNIIARKSLRLVK